MRGDVAMNFWGPWAWPHYKDVVEFDWDVSPPVAGPAGAASYLDGLLLGVSAFTAHPDEAWKLVRFLGYDSLARRPSRSAGVWRARRFAIPRPCRRFSNRKRAV